MLHVKEGIGESLEGQNIRTDNRQLMAEDTRLDMLIDAEDNKYILTK